MVFFLSSYTNMLQSLANLNWWHTLKTERWRTAPALWDRIMHTAQIKIKFEKGDYGNANIQSLTQYADRGMQIYSGHASAEGRVQTIPTCSFGARQLLNKLKRLSDRPNECSMSKQILEMHVEPFYQSKTTSCQWGYAQQRETASLQMLTHE